MPNRPLPNFAYLKEDLNSLTKQFYGEVKKKLSLGIMSSKARQNISYSEIGGEDLGQVMKHGGS